MRKRAFTNMDWWEVRDSSGDDINVGECKAKVLYTTAASKEQLAAHLMASGRDGVGTVIRRCR